MSGEMALPGYTWTRGRNSSCSTDPFLMRVSVKTYPGTAVPVHSERTRYPGTRTRGTRVPCTVPGEPGSQARVPRYPGTRVPKVRKNVLCEF
eukprot:2623391-Rhodomonas_salina.4